MEDPNKICPLVKREIWNGNSRERIFRRCVDRLAPHYNLPAFAVQQWFERLDAREKPGASQLCLPQFHLLLQTIQEYFGQAKRGIEARKCTAKDPHLCKMEMLSERYAVDALLCNSKFKELVLVDLFLEQQRTLPILNSHLLDNFDDLHQIKVIDSEHLILAGRNQTNSMYSIYLLQINKKTLQCSIMDSKSPIINFQSIYFDQENRKKFVICLGNGTYWLGLIRDFRLKLQYQVKSFKPGAPMYCLRLSGGKLDGFHTHDNGSTFIITYKKIDLETTPDKVVKRKAVVNEERIEVNFLKTVHTWHEDVCYLLSSNNDGTNRRFLKFDIETRKLISLDLLNFYSEMPPPTDMFMSENGVLSVCVRDGNFEQHALYRFALSQPDRLANTALLAVSQTSLFLDKKKSKAMLVKVPPTLSSFYFL